MKSFTPISMLAGLLLVSSTNYSFSSDKVVLTMWHNHPEWKQPVEKIISQFEHENPDIEIQLQEIPSTSITARLNTALAAEEAPDLIPLNAGPQVDALARAGQIIDLTGVIDTSGLTPVAQSVGKFNGKLYAVPSFGAFTVGLYYQKKIFADNNLEPPKNQTEFMQVCKALKAKGITPIVMPAQDGVLPAYTYAMMVGSVLKTDGFADLLSGKRKLTDPDVVKAAKFMQDMYPCFQAGSLGTSYAEGKALFALGRGAMIPGGSADYAGYVQTNPKVDVGVVPFPAVDGGTPSTVTGIQNTYGINAATKHAGEAAKFIQWLIGKEAAQMVTDTITLSNSAGVLPHDNPVMTQMIEASQSNDIHVWYQVPQTVNLWGAIQQNSAALFLEKETPEEFASKVQVMLKPSDQQ